MVHDGLWNSVEGQEKEKTVEGLFGFLSLLAVCVCVGRGNVVCLIET